MVVTRTRWRIGVLDSNPHSRAEVSRLIESGGATVVVDAPPRSESVALLRRLAPDAVVLAAEDAMRDGDPVGGVLPTSRPRWSWCRGGPPPSRSGGRGSRA